MPETDQSIQESGIPTINMEVSPLNEIPVPVDDTLSISGQAADAKATGDRIAAIESQAQTIYPVGTIYMSIVSTPPDFGFGTWEEIVMPMTWGDATSGERSYRLVEDGETVSGTVHFWLRTA